MLLVPDAPVDPAVARKIESVLRRDGRWLRASTVVHRATGRRPPCLLNLMEHRRLGDASPEERQAWSVYVENLIPMARSGQVEFQGNIGGGVDDFPTGDMPAGMDFVRVRLAHRD